MKKYLKYIIVLLFYCFIVLLFYCFIVLLLAIGYDSYFENNIKYGSYIGEEYHIECTALGLTIQVERVGYLSFYREYTKEACSKMESLSGKLNTVYRLGKHKNIIALSIGDEEIKSSEDTMSAVFWGRVFIIGLIFLMFQWADTESTRRKREREAKSKELENLIKEKDAQETVHKDEL